MWSWDNSDPKNPIKNDLGQEFFIETEFPEDVWKRTTFKLRMAIMLGWIDYWRSNGRLNDRSS